MLVVKIECDIVCKILHKISDLSIREMLAVVVTIIILKVIQNLTNGLEEGNNNMRKKLANQS